MGVNYPIHILVTRWLYAAHTRVETPVGPDLSFTCVPGGTRGNMSDVISKACAERQAETSGLQTQWRNTLPQGLLARCQLLDTPLGVSLQTPQVPCVQG